MRFLIIAGLILISCAHSLGAQSVHAPVIEFAPSFPEGLKPQVEELVLEAHQQVAGASGTPFKRTITVEWTENAQAFGRRVGMNPEHVMAAADSAKACIILNGEAFNRSTPGERRQTLVHEYVHLFVGQTALTLPLWLEEGLAMHLSGDLEVAASDWQMTLAHSMDRLIPLTELHGQFPQEPARRSLAYRQAYSATAYLLKRNYPVMGAQGLLADIADPVQGVRLETWLDDRMIIHGLERSWREGLSSVWSWIAMLGSAGVFWGIVTLLFLYAYFLRRRRSREIQQRWEEDEPWRQSVPDEFYEGDEEEDEK